MKDLVARWAARRIAEGRAPGAAWWIEQPGCVLRGFAGHAVTSPAAEPLAFDTPFDLASLTKPLATALLLVLLEQEKKLSLEQTAAEHLMELRGSPWQRASLLDLAAHRAGLPAWAPLYLEGDSIEGYLRALIDLAPTAGPSHTVYSDLGYIVLGAVIERVASAGLAELFATRIAQPLGLRRACFACGAKRFDDAAATETGNQYERTLAGAKALRHPWRMHVLRGEAHDGNAHGLGGVAGHAGLFATVEEVATIAREILQPNRLALGSHARNRLLLPAPGSRERTVGFALARASKAARGILGEEDPGHVGFTGTSLWFDLARSRFFVLLTNRVHPTVPSRDFAPVRRAFHRLAARALDAGSSGRRPGRNPRPT